MGYGDYKSDDWKIFIAVILGCLVILASGKEKAELREAEARSGEGWYYLDKAPEEYGEGWYYLHKATDEDIIVAEVYENEAKEVVTVVSE